MSEDESVAGYNERVLEIANESFNLGEKIPESKIVRKVLRSLLGKFDMKLKIKWKEDSEARAMQKEKIQNLCYALQRYRFQYQKVVHPTEAKIKLICTKILVKGNIEKYNVPCLNDVRYVEGLKANLISVSQLGDQGYIVNFSKDDCIVISTDKRVVMSGCRQADNCYH
ncbi:gag-pol polyprotein [Cucumis melo var. makuwa]|uniref:Gag-pol polyprotein n=1 Tax=Cucumis melo var. makuwa TaxID=1194695 RepID=A0A5D3B929_CUCMM|nr:gag-pol polyprotein [Cucumis melo var. makuwa]